MRLVITGLALALAAPVLAGDAGAQPVTTAPLAANEVLLEVNATGSVTTRADMATLAVAIRVQAATAEEARRNAEAQVRRITEAARRAGIAAGDIEAGEIQTYSDEMYGNTMSMDMNMAMETNAAMAAEEMVDASYTPMVAATGQMTVKVRNIARLEAIQAAIAEAGGYASATYTLTDTAGPRREARARAIVAARADAEAYAAALGLRVARIVRVTERSGMDFFSMMMNESAMRARMGMGEQTEPQIETMMSLGVDFALAPR